MNELIIPAIQHKEHLFSELFAFIKKRVWVDLNTKKTLKKLILNLESNPALNISAVVAQVLAYIQREEKFDNEFEYEEDGTWRTELLNLLFRLVPEEYEKIEMSALLEHYPGQLFEEYTASDWTFSRSELCCQLLGMIHADIVPQSQMFFQNRQREVAHAIIKFDQSCWNKLRNLQHVRLPLSDLAEQCMWMSTFLEQNLFNSAQEKLQALLNSIEERQEAKFSVVCDELIVWAKAIVPELPSDFNDFFRDFVSRVRVIEAIEKAERKQCSVYFIDKIREMLLYEKEFEEGLSLLKGFSLVELTSAQAELFVELESIGAQRKNIFSATSAPAQSPLRVSPLSSE